jgi:hypothetical protein
MCSKKAGCMSFPQIRSSALEIPATIIKLLGIDVPVGLPVPNSEITSRFNPRAIVMVDIDNFGLFEAVVYKPEALIKNLEAVVLIETDDPYAVPLTKRLLMGSNIGGFHLCEHVSSFGKVVRVVCRSEDVGDFSFDPSYTVVVRDDMNTYIESTKHVFKSELLFLHFLDFESLYAQYGHRTPPNTLLEKIVRRTDNWIKVLMRQARHDTLFIIVGNHGRHPVPLNYEGKLAEWRKANAPIAIMFQKRSE